MPPTQGKHHAPQLPPITMDEPGPVGNHCRSEHWSETGRWSLLDDGRQVQCKFWFADLREALAFARDAACVKHCRRATCVVRWRPMTVKGRTRPWRAKTTSD